MLGLIGKKVGMTQVFDANGRLTPVTVIKIEDNVVVGNKTEEKNGYSALVLASGDKKKSQVTKPYAGQFKDICEPKAVVMEMRDYDQSANVGDKLGVDLFKDVTFVDVTGTSKGKGFQGGMKRYGFGGGRATHGSKFHRDLGGTAMSSTPSRTFKGHRMAGHMGNEKVTVQNLRVVAVDSEMQVLMVKGAIPGPTESLVIVKKAVKK
ncbi:MAG TPA: 50S ribosomal protein L3 [Candidatus Ornithospirochaeta avicola]|uniref:Large ribosomal subunit protein uL3 n=1 Tax=Candidatus Ornithospirochaeta avicola TaxID=2840896 RepID=A0A9D1PTR1_9SPIO|nr:50S ribosomal protein L3 [Candidatus Ornithospirochaeta avicola]